MPTDVSSRLCGQCHIDTSEEWATSVHGEADLTCSRCHNAHTTEIKADDVHDLCQHCHQERTHSYDLSTHAQQGIQCIECHLPIISDETRLGPGHRVHTFAVNLQSCVACHGDYLHNPEAEPCDPEKILEAQEQGIVYECNKNEITQAGLGFPMAENSLMTQPQDVSPFGFTIIGTLAGVAAGMILAPWLEKWFRRNRE
jgi:hypothetical protein